MQHISKIHTSSNFQINTNRSLIDLIPVELLNGIFSYLNHIDRETISLVCREWNLIILRPLNREIEKLQNFLKLLDENFHEKEIILEVDNQDLNLPLLTLSYSKSRRNFLKEKALKLLEHIDDQALRLLKLKVQEFSDFVFYERLLNLSLILSLAKAEKEFGDIEVDLTNKSKKFERIQYIFGELIKLGEFTKSFELVSSIKCSDLKTEINVKILKEMLAANDIDKCIEILFDIKDLVMRKVQLTVVCKNLANTGKLHKYLEMIKLYFDEDERKKIYQDLSQKLVKAENIDQIVAVVEMMDNDEDKSNFLKFCLKLIEGKHWQRYIDAIDLIKNARIKGEFFEIITNQLLYNLNSHNVNLRSDLNLATQVLFYIQNNKDVFKSDLERIFSRLASLGYYNKALELVDKIEDRFKKEYMLEAIAGGIYKLAENEITDHARVSRCCELLNNLPLPKYPYLFSLCFDLSKQKNVALAIKLINCFSEYKDSIIYDICEKLEKEARTYYWYKRDWLDSVVELFKLASDDAKKGYTLEKLCSNLAKDYPEDAKKILELIPEGVYKKLATTRLAKSAQFH